MGCLQIIFFPFFLVRRLIFGKGISSIGIPLSVLNDYRFDFTGSGEDGELLWIEGRPSFLVAFILNLFGLAPRPSIRVTRKKAHFTYQSLSGTNHLIVPLEDITVADCRFEKPVWRLYLGLFLIIGTPFVLPLLLAAFLLFTYWRAKRIVVTFSTGNISDRAGLAFSRTLMKDIEYDEIVELFGLIHRYIVDAHYARFDNPLSVKTIAEMRNQNG